MRFGNHEDWFRTALLLSLAGALLVGLDRVVHLRGMGYVGTALLLALPALSVLAVVVGLPYAVWVRRTERRKR